VSNTVYNLGIVEVEVEVEIDDLYLMEYHPCVFDEYEHVKHCHFFCNQKDKWDKRDW